MWGELGSLAILILNACMCSCCTVSLSYGTNTASYRLITCCAVFMSHGSNAAVIPSTVPIIDVLAMLFVLMCSFAFSTSSVMNSTYVFCSCFPVFFQYLSAVSSSVCALCKKYFSCISPVSGFILSASCFLPSGSLSKCMNTLLYSPLELSRIRLTALSTRS